MFLNLTFILREIIDVFLYCNFNVVFVNGSSRDNFCSRHNPFYVAEDFDAGLFDLNGKWRKNECNAKLRAYKDSICQLKR